MTTSTSCNSVTIDEISYFSANYTEVLKAIRAIRARLPRLPVYVTTYLVTPAGVSTFTTVKRGLNSGQG